MDEYKAGKRAVIVDKTDITITDSSADNQNFV